MADLFSRAGVSAPAARIDDPRAAYSAPAAAYPAQPGAKTPGTSQAAADSVKPSAAYLRGKVLDALRMRAMTPDECAGRLDLSVLSVRPRFTELSATGAIIPTGERRENASGRNAKVYRAA